MSPSLSWQVKTVCATSVADLSLRHRLSPLAAKVLAARGWQPGEALSAFLAAPSDQAPDPLALVGCREGAQRLWRAIDAGEPITVCGDYDVDGTTGAALLLAFLRGHGAEVGVYLPHRQQDGYGLNNRVIAEFAARGQKVLVTVDNGISSLEEIALAQALGMDVVLTDHHRPGPALPEAHVIVNPQLMSEPGPFAPLAGVGVAYQLIRAMEALRPDAAGAVAADDLLDLVALGTLGDLAPLFGENRRLVKLGLARLGSHPRPGLAALAAAAKVQLGPRPAAEPVAVRLIPRLNAAGRMAHSRLALELLLTESPAEARTLAERLSQLNRQRQQLTETVEAHCRALLADTLDDETPAIVLADERWHPGVIGVVGARLVERFRRPVLLFAREGDGWRGSGRSVKGLDLHAALTEVSAHLGRYGGHKMAVGCTVADGGLAAFTADFLAAIRRQKARSEARSAYEVDAEVPLGELTVQGVVELGCLEPTGAQNPAPVLASRGMRVVRQGVRGNDGQHLWLTLEGQGGRAEAIGFGMGHLHPVPERVDAVFVPMADSWNGKRRVQLKLVALSESAEEFLASAPE